MSAWDDVRDAVVRDELEYGSFPQYVAEEEADALMARLRAEILAEVETKLDAVVEPNEGNDAFTDGINHAVALVAQMREEKP